jgi:alpha-ketoglutarate-dependent taurine dioxygenase
MSAINKFSAIKPKAVRLSQESLVKISAGPEGQFPLVLQPGAGDVNLSKWAGNNRELIEDKLAKHGALLFRNFNVSSVSQFEQFVRAISDGLIEYGERSSPRTKIGNGIYTSTDYPPDRSILLHNEQSYTLNWPMKICFFCVQSARERGNTPIADSRKILKRLSPQLVERFKQKEVMYVRNYGDGLGLPWQEVFQTESRREVEEHCRQSSIEFEWKGDAHLRTFQIRPAVRTHPKTSEAVWFNHALFFNLSSLEAVARQSMLSVVGEAGVPFNTFYGDGSPIELSVLDEVREAYRREYVSLPWQEQDMLILDNMLVAHGREPFAGSRKIVVAMADPFADYKAPEFQNHR